MGGNYGSVELTAKLKKYKANVMGNEGTFESQANTIGSTIDNANLKFKTVADTVGSTCKDPQGATAVAILDLTSQACTRMHDSVINDVGAICAQCRAIDPQIEKVEKWIEEAKNIPRDRLIVEGWDEFQRKVFTGKHNGSNYGRWRDLQDKIKREMEQLEAHIASIASSSYSIDLGITAATLASGQLGPYTSFSDTFNFTKQQWENDHPAVSLTIWQEAGCAVVGAVESVVKVVEGVADAALTVVGGVVSLFTGNDDNWFRRAAQYDVAGTLGKGMASVIGVNAQAYDASIGRKIGNFTGSVVAHGVLWATGVGAVISAVSIAGNSMERNLQNGKTIGESLWRGTLDGAVAYVGGRVLQSVGSKIMPKVSNWVQNSSNFVARTIKAGATSFKDWGTLSLGGKIVSAVASPIRGYVTGVSKAINAGAKWLSPKFTALGEHSKIFKKVIEGDAAFAAKVDKGVDRAFSAAKNAKAAVANKVHSAADKVKNSKIGQKAGELKARVQETATNVKENVKSAASKVKSKITGKTGADTAATSSADSAIKKGASPAGETGAKNAKVTPEGSTSGKAPTTTETGSPPATGDSGAATRKVPTAETITADELDDAFRINSDPNASAADHEWANKVLDVADDATRPASQMGAADSKLNQHAPANITGAPDSAATSELNKIVDAPSTRTTTPTSTATTEATAAAPAGGTPPSGGSKIPGYEPKITGADNVGLPGLSSESPAMTYAEAEHNLKMLEQLGFDPTHIDPTNVNDAAMFNLWSDSTATVANTIPGNANVVLKQGGNWYQNAENMAKVAGYDFLGNGNSGAWGDYTDAVYRLGRIPGNGYVPTQPPVQPPVEPPVNPPVDPPIHQGGSKAEYVFNPGPIIGAVEDKKQEGHRQELGTQGNS